MSKNARHTRGRRHPATLKRGAVAVYDELSKLQEIVRELKAGVVDDFQARLVTQTTGPARPAGGGS